MRREFHFLGERTEDGLISHDRDEVRTTLLDLESAAFQLGGVVSMFAVREQTGPESYVTTGVIMTYESFVPARAREPESELAELPEP